MIGIKRPELETCRLPPWSAEVKSVGRSASLPSHIVMLRHSVKQREREKREFYFEKLSLEFKSLISSRSVNSKFNHEQTTETILIIFHKFVKGQRAHVPMLLLTVFTSLSL
jgi:hypothetical protein